MQIDAALVREQGQTFAVVCVKRGTLDSRQTCEETQEAFAPAFQNVPIILMEQDSRGRPTYFGRPDIVRFLANIDCRRLPWAKWSVS